ncbi:MAG TPA: hypothetical protein VK421_13135 [Pyrinomonadaceae bacterium]|nr:hypothetical protein [Pyrinomonadaceae bacterium]
MEDTKSTGGRPDDAPAGRTRDEQATSDKTLADLERSQTDSATGKGGASETSSPVEGSSPAPDGAAGASHGGRADGSDTGGPM